ncbi:hypothetical protein [Salinibacter grassmerensis]|uniref:hypothetical protein n=1 Tax=Salinibacter grassmerensis TaxID=3040353 RepID=UPI0021E91977|nr:hypothetical protein [Salinibacter grassmerensis]
MSGSANTQNQRRGLRIVRIALLTGIVVFGVITWILGRVVLPGPATPPLAAGLVQEIGAYVEYGFVLTFLGVFGGVIALRSRWKAAEDFEAERQINLAGWALANFTALSGGIYLMLVGDPTFFGAGLALMVLTAFVLLPISESD